MDFFLQVDTWIALLTLTFLEIVLGIDNIIFISIVAGKLPEHQQKKARLIGLTLALVVRIILLMGITWLIGLTEPIIEISTFTLSWRDIILLVGGLFLIAKSTSEIHHKVGGDEEEKSKPKKVTAFGNAIIQIVLLDIIFSFDSILTAVGLTNEISLMVIAVIVSILVMMIFASAINNFINKHPTLQVLALSFLILIGFMLVVEALHYEVPKGYIYFAVFFSLLVEVINMRVRKKSKS
jgi:predicted tellurium resistance membrane protein TerC